MTVGERIKKIRNKIGMSQVDFADKINVSKQTLYKYENNIITNIPSDKIEAAAQLGNVTPSYLMGWEPVADEDIGNIFSNDNLFETIENISSLSPSEKNHFIKYLRLFEINRKKADNYIDQLLSLQNMETDLEVQAAHERTDIEVTEEMRKHDDDLMDSEW
ncbi:MAG: helix-turn-helix domain-containing protein [Lachnospiraceae bacterium]